MDPQLRHCVGGKLLDKHGTVDEPRVTCPRGTASVLEGRERSQPYRTSTRSRADIYNTELTLVSERNGLSPSRPTQARAAAISVGEGGGEGGVQIILRWPKPDCSFGGVPPMVAQRAVPWPMLGGG